MKFFTHDTNSRSNRKLRKVIRVHGATGYAIWWAIIEELCLADEQGFRIEASDLWLEGLAESLCISDYRTLIRALDTFAEIGLISTQLWAEHFVYADSIAERGDAYVKKKARHAESQSRYRSKSSSTLEKNNPSNQSGDVSLIGHAPVSDYHNGKSDSPYTDPDPKANTDPYAKQDPERVTAPRAAHVCDQTFEILPEQPTAAIQEPLASNLTLEIATVPPRIDSQKAQQDTVGIVSDVILIGQKKRALQGRIEPDCRDLLIDEAIATYNQFRGAWGECAELPEGYRNRLYQVFYRQRAGDKREAFLALIRDATLWAARSQWLAKPEFENKNFLFLIGRQPNEKIAEYAASWRSLSEESKVGAVIKISQPKEKDWCNLSGKPCHMAEAWSLWWRISKKAKNEPETLTKIEVDWAKYYFPKYNIYEGADELDD